MELSINTNVISSTGEYEKSFELIRNAGFRYVHWCHHWNHDHIYSDKEIARISYLLKQYDLQVFDMHASAGHHKNWRSFFEFIRKSGGNLLRNRIEMVSSLGGKAIVLHSNNKPFHKIGKSELTQGLKTLQSLEPLCRKLQVKIGIENLFQWESSQQDLGYYFQHIPADVLGLCWDIGHSNIVENGFERIAPFVKDRLCILHAHSNSGIHDEHLPVCEGTQPWDRIVQMIAKSPYDGMLTQEILYQQKEEPEVLLARGYKQGSELAKKIEAARFL